VWEHAVVALRPPTPLRVETRMTAAALIDLDLAYRRFEQPLLRKARLWFPTYRTRP
jgi:hypothetical protein